MTDLLLYVYTQKGAENIFHGALVQSQQFMFFISDIQFSFSCSPFFVSDISILFKHLSILEASKLSLISSVSTQWLTLFYQILMTISALRYIIHPFKMYTFFVCLLVLGFNPGSFTTELHSPAPILFF